MGSGNEIILVEACCPTTSPATPSPSAGWPSHCDDTSATAHAWSPRRARPSSESPYDAKSSAAKGECVPQSLPRKDNAPEPCSAPLFSARPLSIPAESSAASDRQSREAPGRAMHLMSLCLTNNPEIDDCQCKKLPPARKLSDSLWCPMRTELALVESRRHGNRSRHHVWLRGSQWARSIRHKSRKPNPGRL